MEALTLTLLVIISLHPLNNSHATDWMECSPICAGLAPSNGRMRGFQTLGKFGQLLEFKVNCSHCAPAMLCRIRPWVMLYHGEGYTEAGGTSRAGSLLRAAGRRAAGAAPLRGAEPGGRGPPAFTPGVGKGGGP